MCRGVGCSHFISFLEPEFEQLVLTNPYFRDGQFCSPFPQLLRSLQGLVLSSKGWRALWVRQAVVWGLAATAPSGSSLEVKTLRPHPDLLNQNLSLVRSPGDLSTC